MSDCEEKQETIGNTCINSLISENQIGTNLHKCEHNISTTYILIICSDLSLVYSPRTLLTSGMKLFWNGNSYILTSVLIPLWYSNLKKQKVEMNLFWKGYLLEHENFFVMTVTNFT